MLRREIRRRRHSLTEPFQTGLACGNLVMRAQPPPELFAFRRRELARRPAEPVHRSAGHFSERRRKATMVTKHLHVFAIDGTGDTWYPTADAGTGWCWLTVPRLCIFGDDPAEITAWDYGLYHGSLPVTALWIARKAREIQSLDYKLGPAIVMDETAVRLNAMVELLCHEQRAGDSVLHFQERSFAEKINDESLRKLHMLIAHPNINTAVKHALAALRRANNDTELAHELWPYPPSGKA
jgi:hypothetical protein